MKYLARIQKIVDILNSIDDPGSQFCDELENILDGLQDDNSLASIIQYSI